jgi:hypothetical protein
MNLSLVVIGKHLELESVEESSIPSNACWSRGLLRNGIDRSSQLREWDFPDPKIPTSLSGSRSFISNDQDDHKLDRSCLLQLPKIWKVRT